MTDEPDVTQTASPGSPSAPDTDAWGRPRSSRSIPTGPGSRGGTWHLPENRKAYWRTYRLEHPDYRAAEYERSRKRKAEARSRRDELRPTLREVLRGMVVSELEHTSQYKFADATGLDRLTIRWFVTDVRGMSGETMEALISHFSMWRVAREYGRQVRLAREQADQK